MAGGGEGAAAAAAPVAAGGVTGGCMGTAEVYVRGAHMPTFSSSRGRRERDKV